MRRVKGQRKKGPTVSGQDHVQPGGKSRRVSLTARRGEDLERRVAGDYRQVGARKVVHNVDMDDGQIDVYVELPCANSVHRIAVEAKDRNRPVGVGVVRDFAVIIHLLHDVRELIDEGVIVSAKGFTRQARKAANVHHITLLTLDDLDTMVAEATRSGQLAPSIMVFQQAVDSGRYDDAEKTLRGGVVRQLYHGSGNYELCMALVRALFPDGEDHLPHLASEDDQVWTLNVLAGVYARVGDPRAERLYQAANEIDEVLGNDADLAIGLHNLGYLELTLGRLVEAEDDLRRGIDLSLQAGDYFNWAMGHQELGHLLIYEGLFDQAAEQLDAALYSFMERKELQSECVVLQYRALSYLLSGDPSYALDNARRAYRLANQVEPGHFRVERNVLLTKWLLGWALVASPGQQGRQARLQEAKKHLTEALAGCRRIHLVELEPDILLAWARWHRANGDPARALQDAERALTIADRCAYRLKQAEIHLFLAHLALDNGRKKAARTEAETARNLASCSGSSCCYKVAFDEATRLLTQKEKRAEEPLSVEKRGQDTWMYCK